MFFARLFPLVFGVPATARRPLFRPWTHGFKGVWLPAGGTKSIPSAFFPFPSPYQCFNHSVLLHNSRTSLRTGPPFFLLSVSPPPQDDQSGTLSAILLTGIGSTARYGALPSVDGSLGRPLCEPRALLPGPGSRFFPLVVVCACFSHLIPCLLDLVQVFLSRGQQRGIVCSVGVVVRWSGFDFPVGPVSAA